jgi:hypothetical protein
MDGDRPKCYPEKKLLTEAILGWGQQCFSRGDIDLTPDMKGHHFLYFTEKSSSCSAGKLSAPVIFNRIMGLTTMKLIFPDDCAVGFAKCLFFNLWKVYITPNF